MHIQKCPTNDTLSRKTEKEVEGKQLWHYTKGENKQKPRLNHSKEPLIW